MLTTKLEDAIELLTVQPDVNGPEHDAYYGLKKLIEERVLPLLRETREEMK